MVLTSYIYSLAVEPVALFFLQGSNIKQRKSRCPLPQPGKQRLPGQAAFLPAHTGEAGAVSAVDATGASGPEQ